MDNVRQGVEEQLTALKGLYEETGQADAADYSSVFESEGFRELPVAVQDEFASRYGFVEALAAQRGGNGTSGDKEIERSASYASLEEQLAALRGMYETMKVAPDYSPVWDSAEFDTLSDAEKTALRSAFETTVASAPAAQDTAPSKERRENTQPRRKFVGYFPNSVYNASTQTHDWAIMELFDAWNDDKGAYERKTGRTAIVLTDRMRQLLEEEPQEFGEGLVADLNQTRADLDANGVKLYIDEANWDLPKERAAAEPSAFVKDGGVKRLYFKWKYTVDGELHAKDFMDIRDVPKHILDLVKTDKEYWKRKPYKDWFGPLLQQKREIIISDAIAKHLGELDEFTTMQGPDMDVRSSEELQEPEDDVVIVPATAPKAPAPAPTATAPATPKVVVPPPTATKPPTTPAPTATKPTMPVTGKAAPKVDTTPVAARKPDVKAAPAAAPDVAPKPPERRTIDTETLVADAEAGVAESMSHWGGIYGSDPARFAEMMRDTVPKLIAERYERENAVVAKGAVQDAVEAAIRKTLSLGPRETTTPDAGPVTRTESRFTLHRDGSLALELGSDVGALRDGLAELTEQALAKVTHEAVETATIAEHLASYLTSGKHLKDTAYEPGARFLVQDPDDFKQKIRELHARLQRHNAGH